MEAESVAVDIIPNIPSKSLPEFEGIEEVLSTQAPPSIYMVPSLVRDLSPSSFTPRVVAIGPLHRQDPHLQGFEVQKTTYMHTWLHRLGIHAPEKMLENCAVVVLWSIERIKACYAGLPTNEDIKLAKMMVLDACFILEFIQNLSNGKSCETNLLITQSIIHDLLLIENQIPFFVLENVSNFTLSASGRTNEWPLTNHLTILINSYNFIKGNVVEPDVSDADHVLGYLHKYFQPMKSPPLVYKSDIEPHTAMELDRAGMKFKPNTKDQDWALAMKMELPIPLFPWFHNFTAIPPFSWFHNFMVIPSFSWYHILMAILPFSWFRPPTLMMPKLKMDDESEWILRNLVVYEQSPNVKKYITAYLMAMDMLINTPEDVSLLVKSKVLESNLGSTQEAADMINKLCKNIRFPDLFYYQQSWEEMDVYCNSYWPHTISWILRTYFNNPWNSIALIAAVILFGLTVVQTIYTITAA